MAGEFAENQRRRRVHRMADLRSKAIDMIGITVRVSTAPRVMMVFSETLMPSSQLVIGWKTEFTTFRTLSCCPFPTATFTRCPRRGNRKLGLAEVIEVGRVYTRRVSLEPCFYRSGIQSVESPNIQKGFVVLDPLFELLRDVKVGFPEVPEFGR